MVSITRFAALLLLVAGAASATPYVVQAVQCASATGAPSCAFTGNVANGNTIFVGIGKFGGACNGTPITDTRGFTFTLRIDVANPSGDSATTCIYNAPVTVSGAETVTHGATGQPQLMWVWEMANATGFTLETSNTAIPSATSPLTPGSVTAGGANRILICVGANTGGALFASTASPAGGAYSYMGPVGTFPERASAVALYQFVGAGTYTCSFTLSGDAPARESVIATLFSFTPSAGGTNTAYACIDCQPAAKGSGAQSAAWVN